MVFFRWSSTPSSKRLEKKNHYGLTSTTLSRTSRGGFRGRRSCDSSAESPSVLLERSGPFHRSIPLFFQVKKTAESEGLASYREGEEDGGLTDTFIEQKNGYKTIRVCQQRKTFSKEKKPRGLHVGCQRSARVVRPSVDFLDFSFQQSLPALFG